MDSPQQERQTDTTLIEEPNKWQFSFGLFLVRHKILLKRLFYFALFFINILILANLGLKWLHYSTGELAYNRMLAVLSRRDLIDYNFFRTKNKPVDLKVIKTRVLAADTSNYDLIAWVLNNNKNWMVEGLAYRFVVDDDYFLPIQNAYILPQQTKILTFFNFSTKNKPRSLKLELMDVGWRKVTDIERLQIYKDIKINKAAFSLEGDGSGRVEWEVSNHSAYSFWSVGFQLVLYGGDGEVVGINYFRDEKIKSLESKKYDLDWHSRLPAVYNVEVIVDLNVFDQTVFMPFGIDGYHPTRPY